VSESESVSKKLGWSVVVEKGIAEHLVKVNDPDADSDTDADIGR